MLELREQTLSLPALHHTVASLKPKAGSSTGLCPRAELWEFTCGGRVPGWQPALPCHPGTAWGTHRVQGAEHWALAGVWIPSSPCSRPWGASCREGCVSVRREGCAFIPELGEPLSFLALLLGLKKWGERVIQPLKSVGF